jgi:predicted GNAT family acetyltransferase
MSGGWNFFLIRELSQHLMDPGCTVYLFNKLDLKKRGLKRKKDMSTAKAHGPTQQIYCESKYV